MVKGTSPLGLDLREIGRKPENPEMLREFRADLHIHSCLSPCASLDLSPRKIVRQAQAAGLDMIAVTDHNSARNTPAILRLGEARGLAVIPGMEVQTREEIHLLTLFPGWPAAAAWEEEIRRHLPEVPNPAEVLGDQPIVDEEDNVLGFEERLLLNSVDLSLEEIISRVEERGGLTIPSHFDKGSFSLISQLGLIPQGLEVAALEVSRKERPGERSEVPGGFSWIVSSDAHRLEEIGSAWTVFRLAAPTLEELGLALRGQAGRRIARRIDRGAILW
ncbi:MAG: PHP domain-containing protein [Deltaproteobacteria bacterium]|nr:PHP domain-containing protein [Deltaproteobacteria bacterium]